MWWNKPKAAHEARIEEAKRSQDFADKVITQIDSQEDEVTQITGRLEKRAQRNHFGEALTIAMERRNA